MFIETHKPNVSQRGLGLPLKTLDGKGEFKNCANLVAPGDDQHRVESQYPTLLNTLFLLCQFRRQP